MTVSTPVAAPVAAPAAAPVAALVFDFYKSDIASYA